MSFTLESLQRARTAEETLRYLADTRAIHDVLSLYCRAQDRCDRALLEAVFHEDAFDSHGGIFQGSVRDFCGFALEKLQQCDVATHHLCQVLIDVDGDVALTEAYAIAFHRIQRDGISTDSIWSARVLDRFERRNSLWRIAAREVVYDWNIDARSHERWSSGFFPPPVRSR